MIARFNIPDRYTEKYYGLSPYQYAGNTPINAVDINGDSIWYTQIDDRITMHVTAKIINMSTDNINMSRAASDIARGIEAAFAGEFTIGGITYTLTTDIRLGVAGSMRDVHSSDHLFVLADQDPKSAISAKGATSMLGGMVMTLGADQFRNENWFSNSFLHNDTRTAVHEFGHAAGLTHETAGGWSNLMTQGGWGTNVSSDQRSTLLQRRNQINVGPNAQRGRPYPYIHYYDLNRRVNGRSHIQDVGLKYKR